VEEEEERGLIKDLKRCWRRSRRRVFGGSFL
jgi:hypothetical protein